MDPGRWPEVSRVFGEASALDGKARSAYLDDACQSDAALRAEVESLLAADQAGGPIDRPFVVETFGVAPTSGPAAGRLSLGARLGPYIIQSWVGAGGMGEVYRALDTKLGRAVAIKVLPDSVAHEADRRSRLEREARALAALNHPHVGAIYGLEESGDVAALVLEFVEGPTLDERLARGRLPVAEITHIARQLAEALEAAHDSGIVHRDLKPANIKITPDGNVKVLDFGLAKAFGSTTSPSSAEPDRSPVSTPHASPNVTQHGTIVGTPGYMSPEQARGDAVDKRADIWAFGCVVFEMCSGVAPFAGATIADATTAAVEREPAWDQLPETTPRYLVHLVQRCLTKDPKLRLRDIGEARIALLLGAEGVGAVPWVSLRLRRRLWLVAATATLIGLAGLAFGIWSIASRPSSTLPPPSKVQFRLYPPDGVSFHRNPGWTFLALSPDGSQIAFVGLESDGTRVYLRALSDLDARPLAGTDGAHSVFWSPDGRSLGFLTDQVLKRIDLPSGGPVTLGTLPVASGQGTWGSRGEILLGMGNGTAIYSMPAAGGTAREVVTADRSKGEVRVHWPSFLPDGVRFLYTARLADGEGELRLGHLDGGSSTILRAASNAQWSGPDTIVYAREGVLLAQLFDLESARPVGDPVELAQPIDYFFTTSRATFSVSQNGAVAYHAGGDLGQLVWVDQRGNEVGLVGGPAEYEGQSGRLSRDGTTFLTARQQSELGTYDLWRLDLVRNTEERLTAGRGSELTPLWVDDERAIVYVADSGGSVPHLFRKDLGTGVEEALVPAGTQQLAMDVFPDDGAIGFAQRTPGGAFDLYRLSRAAGASPEPLLRSRQPKFEMRVSPDGRAMAFMSEDAMRWDLQVISLPVRGASVIAAAAIGGPPRWSADGRWLYYLGLDGSMMTIPVRTAPTLSVGTPERLFEMKRPALLMDVSRDGRFLMLVSQVSADRQPIIVNTAGIDQAR